MKTPKPPKKPTCLFEGCLKPRMGSARYCCEHWFENQDKWNDKSSLNKSLYRRLPKAQKEHGQTVRQTLRAIFPST